MNYYQNDPAVAAGGERENARRVQTPLMARPVTAELADDFSLPDYKPEIRRMIGITATVSPAAHYLSPGHAEFAGPVRYSILYEGSDGGMWSADLPSEYDLDLTLDNDPTFEPDGMIAYADVVCESVTVRVTAPRRLSVRARLRADAVVLGMRRLDETVSGDLPPMISSGLREARRRLKYSARQTILPNTPIHFCRMTAAAGKCALYAAVPSRLWARSRQRSKAFRCAASFT